MVFLRFRKQLGKSKYDLLFKVQTKKVFLFQNACFTLHKKMYTDIKKILIVIITNNFSLCSDFKFKIGILNN